MAISLFLLEIFGDLLALYAAYIIYKQASNQRADSHRTLLLSIAFLLTMIPMIFSIPSLTMYSCLVPITMMIEFERYFCVTKNNTNDKVGTYTYNNTLMSEEKCKSMAAHIEQNDATYIFALIIILAELGISTLVSNRLPMLHTLQTIEFFALLCYGLNGEMAINDLTDRKVILFTFIAILLVCTLPAMFLTHSYFLMLIPAVFNKLPSNLYNVLLRVTPYVHYMVISIVISTCISGKIQKNGLQQNLQLAAIFLVAYFAIAPILNLIGFLLLDKALPVIGSLLTTYSFIAPLALLLYTLSFVQDITSDNTSPESFFTKISKYKSLQTIVSILAMINSFILPVWISNTIAAWFSALPVGFSYLLNALSRLQIQHRSPILLAISASLILNRHMMAQIDTEAADTRSAVNNDHSI